MRHTKGSHETRARLSPESLEVLHRGWFETLNARLARHQRSARRAIERARSGRHDYVDHASKMALKLKARWG